MAIEVKHKFASEKADGADDSLIKPSNWNDTHDITISGPALIGKADAGTGAAVEISLAGGLAFSGTALTIEQLLVRADATQSLSSAQKTTARNNIGIWHGTQAQYNAIGTKDANTLYFIT